MYRWTSTTSTRKRWGRPVAAVALASALAVGPASAAAPATPAAVPAAPVVVAAVTDELSFLGHGWGHGRGMGQYGALGYAVDHGWGYRAILDHFYGGTSLGQIGNPPISVELTALTGQDLVVTGPNLRVNGLPANSPALLVRWTGSAVTVAPVAACSGTPGSLLGTYAAGVAITTPASSSTSDVTLLPRVCEATGQRAYRGALTVQPHATTGQQTTFNVVPTEDYLRGVVPRESPSSWGTLPNGMEALKAQAVAARSYALAGSRPSGAKTCDTTACQVYGGAARWPQATPAGPSLEAATTDAAIAATAGEVRLRSGSATPVRTEFSSSTGGWTAGGDFPAVEDLGDDIAANPNHTWNVTFTTAQIAARLGLSAVRSVDVTGRNGLGDLGGRVTNVRVVDGAGVAHTYTGAAFRTAMGTSSLKSDWFAVSGFSLGAAESVVKALYADLLGRGVDPTGLATWSMRLASGTSQSALVAELTRSDEYINLRVAKAYREVLGREPEAQGSANWLLQIKLGRATVDDVQRRFFDSQEFMNRSGGTVEGYVAAMYRAILGRDATAGEVSAWSTKYAANGRSWVVDQIWFSQEAARNRAGAYYRVFLQREPDGAGLANWATVLLTQGEGAVRTGIAGSQEYRSKALVRYP